MDLFNGHPGRGAPVRLRPYQERAVNEIHARVANGVRRIVIVAPTGSGKCVSPDTLVWSQGLRPFGDIWGGDSIAAPYTTAEVKGWYDDGERDGYKATLDCGLTIDGTSAHRVWVRTADGFEGWRNVGDLTADDYVAVARGQSDFGARSIPLDEAYALGLLIADGCIVGSHVQIDKQRPVLERIIPVVERWCCWAGNPGGTIRINDVSPRHAVLHANGNFRALFRDRYGIDWGHSPQREVPRSVLEGTREVVQAFLRGYFDGDGYCSPYPAVSTASRRLAEQVQQLLLALGVYTGLRTKETTHLPAHIIDVRDVDAFRCEVGFTRYGLTKDRAFEDLLRKRRNTNIDIVPGVGGIIRSATRWIPGHTLRDDAWRRPNAYYSGKQRPSYSKLAELAVALPECQERDELMRLIIEYRAWSRVTSVEPSRVHRIDCEVPAERAFVGNGVINHNTTIAAHLIADAVEQDSRVLFMAHRRELITQAYNRLVQLGVPENQLGVLMGKDHRLRPGAPVQVASVDTLRNRAKPLADIVFLDESHRAVAKTNRDIAAHYPNAIHLGLTATPFRANGEGLGQDYDDLLLVASVRELIEQGHLVEPRVFTVPPESLPDLTAVRINHGDYDQKALANAVDKTKLVGNLVEHWFRHAQGVRTIAFAVSVAHSQHIAEQFRNAGVAAEHLDGTSPIEERDAVLQRLTSGETTVVTNCGLFGEGLDLPAAKCAILARPTRSTGLYLQQAGRIMRPWNGEQAIILDHGGCVLEHGLPQDDRQFTLEGKKKRAGRKTREAPVRVCPSCFAVLPLMTRVCPQCGRVLIEGSDIPTEHEGELVEVQPEDLKQIEWRRLQELAAERGYKPGWAFYRFKEKFGERPPRTSPARNQKTANWRIIKHTLRQAARSGRSIGWGAIDGSLNSQ